MFNDLRHIPNSLSAKGMELAGMTQIWSDLLKIKSSHNLIENGVNYPNDFEHCIYAQVLLLLFVDSGHL